MARDEYSPATLAQVEAALPDDCALPVRDIARRIEMLAPTTVRHVLRVLVLAGKASREGPFEPHHHMLYRRAAA